MFAQVEPITPNKLGLPPYPLLCSSSLSPPHLLISLVWVVIWKPGQIHSKHLLSNKQGSNGCLPKVQEPLYVRKLNMSDRQNGCRQITVALSWAIDWKKADVNCYQQPYMYNSFWKRACQMDGVRIQIKNLFVCLELHLEQADDPASASSNWSRSRRPHNQKIQPPTPGKHHSPLCNHVTWHGPRNVEIWSPQKWESKKTLMS